MTGQAVDFLILDSLSVFNAPAQVVTSTSISLRTFSLVGSGLKTLKFSKSVNKDNWTRVLTSANFSSPITNRRLSAVLLLRKIGTGSARKHEQKGKGCLLSSLDGFDIGLTPTSGAR